MIVDAHHHLWSAARGDYHWMSPDDPVLGRDYLPADLAPLLRRAGVDRTVLVQAAQTEAETQFLLELAAASDFVAGVVGWLDFDDAELPRKLEKLLRQPKFVGLRPMLQDIEDDAYILRPRVLQNLRHVAELGVPFDFLTYPRHLRNVARALEAVPGLRAVIDHVSKPPIASGRLESWAEDIARIAAEHPGVRCKLSGMVTEADLATWRPADLAPFVRHVVSTFGEDRILFGSDWPVCLLAASYAEVLNALRTLVAPLLDAAGLEKLFGRNAIAFYKLEV
ncbi:MAG: amidohydrolase family protein [Candidatus Kaistia colombiensis]|nr:MAG: amidohydrolase family protein [Kaistia sp.]